MQFTGDGDTHTEAASNSMAAARSAPSFNTAAYRLAECDRSAAAHSAASSDATADAMLIGCSSLSD